MHVHRGTAGMDGVCGAWQQVWGLAAGVGPARCGACQGRCRYDEGLRGGGWVGVNGGMIPHGGGMEAWLPSHTAGVTRAGRGV